jgi:murein DD-endopeptidase MepM/ murein hydrolase activator NlpD
MEDVMVSGTAVRLLLLAAALGTSDRGLSHAQERAAILESVDLLVPLAPATVAISGATHIVYELHITNLLPVDVSITRIQVKRADLPGVAIADYRDGDLASRIGRPGLRRGEPNPQIVGPGMRTAAYLWIPLAEGAAAPKAIEHRVELDVLRPSGPVHVTVDGASASVSGESAVVLDPPLRGGPWAAIYSPLLKGGHRTATYTVGGRARIPARFAIDWIRLPASGAMEPAGVSRPADWNGYGADVLAVADGIVAAALDDIADTAPGTAAPAGIENESGNYVALALGRERFVFYEHLQRGSIAVKAGERVKRGQVIARLGNSGSSSMGPHLHFHVSDASSPIAAEGLPFVFDRFEQLGAFRSIEALVSGEPWLADSGGRANVRIRERPAANSVVQFP